MHPIMNKFNRLHGSVIAAAMLFCIAGLTGCHHEEATGAAAGNTESTHLIKYGQQDGLDMDPASTALAGIETVTIGLKDLQATLRPTGQVAATDSDTAQAVSRLPGRIVEANVSVGDTVRRGQIIAMVDSVDLTNAEAAYQSALSHLSLTQKQLQQQKTLNGYGTVSEQPIEDASRAFSAAQAAVAGDVAQLKLDRTTLENTQQLVNNGELTQKPLTDAHTNLEQARSSLSAAEASVASDDAQLELDNVTLANTKQLVANGELTRKPLDDAQNNYAQAQSALTQSQVTLHSTKANLDRTKVLYDGGVFSKQQLEDAETAYNTALAAVDQNQTQEALAKDELNRQHNIFESKLNESSALQPAQSKLAQDQHTYLNDKVTVATSKTAFLHAQEEYDRQKDILDHHLNTSTALQPAQSKLQQDEHTYQNDLITQETTRKELSRATLVHTSGIPNSQALQSAQDAYDEAKVAMQGAEQTLRLYGVTPGQSIGELENGHIAIPVLAPITGIVVSRNMVVGQITDNATALVKIENLDQVYVDGQVYESDLSKIAVGDSSRISVAAYPGRIFTGRIQYIGTDVAPDTRTVTVRTILPNPGWFLRPGMFATVLIGRSAGTPQLSVPADALLQDGNDTVVFQEVAPHQYLKRAVKVGQTINGNAVVMEGLEPGAKVVTTGNALIQNELDKLADEKGKG